MILVELGSIAVQWVKQETLLGTTFKRNNTGGITSILTFVFVTEHIP
jgi:hypothetical protein